jgi:hypothetical protein
MLRICPPVAALLLPALLWAQGYRVEPGQVAVEAQHWAEWAYPSGTVVVDAQGARPAFVAPSDNAIPQAAILAAGSDPGGAAFLLDGDPSTYWEPDITAPPESWFVQIDLGRTVNATRIVLRFAGEGQGDPFYQFSVLTSNGSAAFSGSKAMAFNRVGRTEQPNTAQRLFSFPLNPLRPADQGFAGDPIRFVLIQMTDSRRDRAEELSPGSYEALPAAERGAVDYYRREASGRERLVDRDQYQALAEEARGPVRYYRRELPRLADVEVQTAGDNLALAILERGGRLEGFGSLGSEALLADGDYTTSWATPSAYAEPTQEPDRHLFIDLGALFSLDRIQLMYVVTPASGPFPNYVMKVSDGARAPDGSLAWTPVAAQGVGAFNTIGAAVAADQEIREYQAILFPLTKARYFQLDYQVQVYFGCSGLGCSATIREVQFYGRGFLPEVVLESAVIDLGGRPRALGAITWDAEVPEGARLQLRTRTGNQLERRIRYFNKTGGEVTEAQYRKLLSFQRGDSLVTWERGADWSPWSQYYESSGDLVASPSPRRYLMIQAALLTSRPEQAVRLRRARVELASPLASELVGELSPGQLRDTGREQPLTLYVRPSFQSGDPGFDRLRLAAPPGTPLSLRDLQIGTEEELRQGTARRLGRDQLSLVSTSSDSLWILLPEVIAQDRLVALNFSAVFYAASNVFEVAAGLGEGPGAAWQQVEGGEATSLGPGKGLNVLAPFAEQILRSARVYPNPFTPNGDGVNEVQTFEFSVFKISGAKPLFLEVRDLAGRRLRRIETLLPSAVGVQRLEWDGRDQGGALVPPGLYLCRFGLEVDDPSRGGTALTRVVSVTY